MLSLNALAACGGNDSSPLVGTWHFDFIAIDGEQIECPVSIEIDPGFSVRCTSEQTVTFERGGWYRGSSPSFPASSVGFLDFDSRGSWSVLDETLTMENSDFGFLVVEVVIDDEVMVWTFVDFFDQIDAELVLQLSRH